MPIALALIVSLLVHGSLLVFGELSLPGTCTTTSNEFARIDARLGTGPGEPPSLTAAGSTKAPPSRQSPKPASMPKPGPAAESQALPPTHLPVVAEETPKRAENTASAEKPLTPVESASPDADANTSNMAPERAEEGMLAVRQQLPESGRVRYSVTRGEGGLLIGQSIHTWSHDGTSYSASNLTETTGLAALFKSLTVKQESRGRIDALGLHPDSFRNEHPKRTDIARIDRVTQTVVNGENNHDLGDWARVVQDMLSMHYQLVMLAGGLSDAKATPDALKRLQLPIATGRKLATYQFQVLGTEMLSGELGDISTLRVQARNGEDLIDFWLAPDDMPLPLRVRYIDRKGDVYDQLVVEYVKGKRP